MTCACNHTVILLPVPAVYNGADTEKGCTYHNTIPQVFYFCTANETNTENIFTYEHDFNTSVTHTESLTLNYWGENTCSHNRYAYAFNNPLIYSDPDGEWAILVAIAVGGIINRAVNGADFTWEGLSYFGVGAGTAALGSVGGPLAPVLAGGFAGAGNSFVSQGFAGGDGNTWNGNINWDKVGQNALTGAATAYIGGQLSGKIAPYVSKYTSKLGGPVVQDMATNSVTSAATGFTIGSGMTALNGGNFNESMQAGWNNAKVGFVVGGASGIVSGFQRARTENVNPWNGNRIGLKGLNETISIQKQARHITGTAKQGGVFLNSVGDAQSVLDAVHSGKATYLGTSKAGHQVYRYNGVTGTNVNIGAGITGQPTNVFMIKGTASPSIVPTNPLWKP